MPGQCDPAAEETLARRSANRPQAAVPLACKRRSRMSYKLPCEETAEYFEDQAHCAGPSHKRERLTAKAEKYRLRAQVQRDLKMQIDPDKI
jgi:hypothetical protein